MLPLLRPMEIEALRRARSHRFCLVLPFNSLPPPSTVYHIYSISISLDNQPNDAHTTQVQSWGSALKNTIFMSEGPAYLGHQG